MSFLLVNSVFSVVQTRCNITNKSFNIDANCGCDQRSSLSPVAASDPPPFRLNMTNVVAKQISPEHQQAIANILGAMFGTPDEPFAMPETGLDERQLKMAAGPVWSDEAGGKHGLYRRHCAHCHGISGDGQGPTAAILESVPARLSAAAYSNSKAPIRPREPTDEDLHRVIYDGIPGTAMPSFAMLPPDEVDALVEYVKYLSIRGQTETVLENYVGRET